MKNEYPLSNLSKDYLKNAASANELARNITNNSIISKIYHKIRNLYHHTNEVEKDRLILLTPFIIWLGLFIGFEYYAKEYLIPIIILSIFLLILYFIIKNHFPKLHLIRLIKPLLLFSIGIILANITIGIHKYNYTVFDRIYEINGDVVNINRSQNGNWQVKVKIEKIDNNKYDLKFIKLYFKNIDKNILYKSIYCKAKLSNPSLPVYPKAYNYAKTAYFQDVIATGTCLNEPRFKPKQLNLLEKALFQYNKLRIEQSEEFALNKRGGGGGLLAALTTGDRTWISSEDWHALQVSGLGHIVSVSGLHISLIGGFIYLILNKLLSLISPIALKYDTRKISAFISIILLINYTIFTGYEAPAVRSLIMAMVAFIAIIIDRKAISMRGLSFAAVLQLILKPDSAIDVSFQMSFMATLALIAMWEFYNKRREKLPKNILFKIFEWIGTAILISLVAGLATLPISIYNFGQISSYSIIANLAATPVNDFLIGPFCVLGAIFSCFGLGDIFWNIARFGSGLIINIGYYFSALKFSNFNLNYFDETTYIFLLIAIIFICLFKSRIRFLSIAFLGMASLNFAMAKRPVLLITRSGNAMLNVNPNIGEEIKICYSKNANWEANTLIRSAKLDYQETDILIKNINFIKSKPCSIASGDWRAHFVMIDETNIEPLVALDFNGKTYAIDKNNAPNGAILYRQGWKLILYKPEFKKTYYN